MELKQYFTVVKKWWWLIAASMLVSTASGYYAVSRTPRIFEATTTARVGQAIELPNPTYQDFSISHQLAQTYMNMVSRRPVLAGAADALGLSFVPRAEDISARLVPGTQFLEISARDTDPERARAIANAIAQQLILQTPNEIAADQARQTFVQTQLANLEDSIQETEEEIQSEQEKLDTANSARAIQQYQDNLAALQAKLASYQATYASLLDSVQGRANYISIFEEATTPSEPISPRVMQTVLMAAAIGLVLALGGAFLIEFLDDTVKTVDDLTRLTELPLLGSIARMNVQDQNHVLMPVQKPQSLIAEAYRTLRTNIQVSSVDNPLRTLVVTSPGPFDGKSTTTANLGVVMAQAGKSVILVDADLRRSVLHRIFHLPNEGGLTRVLVEDEPTLDGWLQETEIDNLRVLTSGPLPPNPSELLGSQKMRSLIEQLTNEADVVIFDTPPVLPVTDASVLAIQANGVLLVTDAGKTRRGAVRQAVESLKQVGANILGTVLNRVALQKSEYHYYYQKAAKT
ncbi:MAG: polysaccharide biosynthesis tyrosine autokinase [Anaerolineae bacterium]|jgi:non-specific protein-tyrosine kinase